MLDICMHECIQHARLYTGAWLCGPLWCVCTLCPPSTWLHSVFHFRLYCSDPTRGGIASDIHNRAYIQIFKVGCPHPDLGQSMTC